MKILSHTPIWRRIVRRGSRALFDLADNNGVSDIRRNGELWLIGRLLSFYSTLQREHPLAIIDAGANAGDYSAAVLQEAGRRRCPVDIHAIEPSPRSAGRLRARFADYESVRIVQAAIGNCSGTATLHGGESGSSQASLVSREVLTGAVGIEVPVLRLEDYLREQSIQTVQLLKLDVEGFELSALEGLGGSLHPDVVDVIQFEYGGTTLDARTTLRDLCDLLSQAGYLIGKLYPHSVCLCTYAPSMEHYAYSNFVALSPRWQDIIRKERFDK